LPGDVAVVYMPFQGYTVRRTPAVCKKTGGYRYRIKLYRLQPFGAERPAMSMQKYKRMRSILLQQLCVTGQEVLPYQLPGILLRLFFQYLPVIVQEFPEGKIS